MFCLNTISKKKTLHYAKKNKFHFIWNQNRHQYYLPIITVIISSLSPSCHSCYRLDRHQYHRPIITVIIFSLLPSFSHHYHCLLITVGTDVYFWRYLNLKFIFCISNNEKNDLTSIIQGTTKVYRYKIFLYTLLAKPELGSYLVTVIIALESDKRCCLHSKMLVVRIGLSVLDIQKKTFNLNLFN